MINISINRTACPFNHYKTTQANILTKLINCDEDYTGTMALALSNINKCHEEPLFNIPVTHDEGLVSWLLDRISSFKLQLNHIDASENTSRFILTQYAPQGLLTGCVIQNFNNASNCHEPVPALVHSIHSWQVGNGIPEENHSNLFRQVLEMLGQHLPSLSSDRFMTCAKYLESSWGVAIYQLSLSLFPERYPHEILGAMLFDLALDFTAHFQQYIGSELFNSRYYAMRQSHMHKQMMENATEAIKLSLQSHTQAAEGIIKGFITSMHLYEKWAQDVCNALSQNKHHPQNEMVQLITDKAKFTIGYHTQLKLSGQSFEELIGLNPGEFVKILSKSVWIAPGHPESSLLLTKLIGFGGPMFRVFSDSEIRIIEKWITALPDIFPENNNEMLSKSSFKEFISIENRMTASRRSKLPTRELYHRLLNPARFSDIHEHALIFSQRRLASSARNLYKDSNKIPFAEYSHTKLRTWFEQKALSQVEEYINNLSEVDKTREEVIDEAVQLCPMILIDGAWLQRWGNAGLVEGRIGASLYKIYSDEIGNGLILQNHSNIYRALLGQMGVKLPCFRTREFAYSTIFDDLAFEVPTFWLSISQYPRRFLPETLGLNLAMELSGVGGSYRTARDELQHHGFDTLFVDLHNTIDNVSSGHSAIALQTIETHMDEIMSLCDAHYTQKQWERVWIGYRSLSITKRRWLDVFN